MKYVILIITLLLSACSSAPHITGGNDQWMPILDQHNKPVAAVNYSRGYDNMAVEYYASQDDAFRAMFIAHSNFVQQLQQQQRLASQPPPPTPKQKEGKAKKEKAPEPTPTPSPSPEPEKK